MRSGTPILTVEDHAVIGGFGACVLEACNERRLPTENIHRIGLPDAWIYQGSRKGQLAEVGIDPDGIAAKVREVLREAAGVKTLRAVETPKPAASKDEAAADAPMRRHALGGDANA